MTIILIKYECNISTFHPQNTKKIDWALGTLRKHSSRLRLCHGGEYSPDVGCNINEILHIPFSCHWRFFSMATDHWSAMKIYHFSIFENFDLLKDLVSVKTQYRERTSLLSQRFYVFITVGVFILGIIQNRYWTTSVRRNLKGDMQPFTRAPLIHSSLR